MIDRRLETVFASIADATEAFEAGAEQRKQETSLLRQEHTQLKAAVEELRQDTARKLQATAQSVARLRTELELEMADTRQNRDTERQEAAKVRKNLTVQVRSELAKLEGLGATTKVEFQRINKFIGKSAEVMKLLMEDQMLMQLMQEQEIIDRK